MATKSIQIRIDEKLQKRVKHVLSSIGIDAPTAIRMFFVKIAATGEIPFSLRAHQEDTYSPKQLRMIDALACDALEGKNLSREFTSGEDLIEDLHASR